MIICVFVFFIGVISFKFNNFCYDGYMRLILMFDFCNFSCIDIFFDGWMCMVIFC